MRGRPFAFPKIHPAIWAVAAAFLSAIGALSFWPARIPQIPQPREIPLSYPEAASLAVSESLQIPPEIAGPCAATVFLNGQKTRRSFLLLHGLSNCPAQFAELGRMLHARGYNVYIPRLPGHGFKNRLTPEYGGLDLSELANWLGGSLEIARGLGEEVTVVGLSVNGASAAWLAQERRDVARAVILAPFLAPSGIPEWASGPLGRLLSRAPNMFIWWDAQKKQDFPGPPLAYPWFPTRVVGKFMALGSWIYSEASVRAPACKSFAFAISDADAAINTSAAWALADRYAKWGGVGVERLRFPENLRVPHDFIDPAQPDQKTDLVYPRLMELLDPKPLPDR